MAYGSETQRGWIFSSTFPMDMAFLEPNNAPYAQMGLTLGALSTIGWPLWWKDVLAMRKGSLEAVSPVYGSEIWRLCHSSSTFPKEGIFSLIRGVLGMRWIHSKDCLNESTILFFCRKKVHSSLQKWCCHWTGQQAKGQRLLMAGGSPYQGTAGEQAANAGWRTPLGGLR